MNPETKQLESKIADWLLAQCQEQYSSLAHIAKESIKGAKRREIFHDYSHNLVIDDSCQMVITYDLKSDSYSLDLKPIGTYNSYLTIGDLLLDVKNNAIKLSISSNIEKWVYKLLTAYFPIY